MLETVSTDGNLVAVNSKVQYYFCLPLFHTNMHTPIICADFKFCFLATAIFTCLLQFWTLWSTTQCHPTFIQGRQKHLKSGLAPNTEATQWLSVLHTAWKIFLPLLIELSGSSSQHEDAQSIHTEWDTSIVQEIIDNCSLDGKLQPCISCVLPLLRWTVWILKPDQPNQFCCPCHPLAPPPWGEAWYSLFAHAQNIPLHFL